jgi:hypothetical protein
VASPDARSSPAAPKPAGRTESAGGPASAGLGRTTYSPQASAADLCLWVAPDRGHTAAGLRHRRARAARAGAPGQRGQRPRPAARPAGADVIAAVLTAPAAPPLDVPRPGRRGATPRRPLCGNGAWARRVIQDLRGHKSPHATARDTPLTPPTWDAVPAPVNALMADLEAAGARPCRGWRTSAVAIRTLRPLVGTL